MTRMSVAAGMVFAAAVGIVSPAQANARREQADVYAAGSQRLLYREEHLVQPGASPERWVVYRCPDGKPFARKRVAAGGARPDFALEDARDGYREGVRGAGDARQVYVGLAGKETSRRVPVPADGVIDAGFDAAVRTHWAQLMRGESVQLRFLVPSRKQFFPVQLRRMGSAEWNGIRAERLRMKLDTWFGFAVPEVTLVYARDGRRLLEFNGTGNLRDGRGRNPQVRIAFQPQAQLASASDLAGVARLPLDGRCSF
ncbi:hypothetical protein [Thermomonas mangrovi]|uniref:hypothetical protein n=1 Tax=Thermomonas mangrovi TaxID=2993316 RepID=UPI0023070C3F|nr:hypothetical protein [Thermomonas mangrovi]